MWPLEGEVGQIAFMTWLDKTSAPVAKLPRFQPRFSIFSLAVLTTLICLSLFAWTQLRLPSVSRRGHNVIDLHTRNDLETPDWLSRYPGLYFDTYEFRSRKSQQAVMNELDSLRIENFKLSESWYVGNSGYSRFKTLLHTDTGQVLQISVKWVPADRENVIRFVWRRVQKVSR